MAQLSQQSMFTVALQSGLAALKTPQCYKQTSSLHLALTASVQPSMPDIPTFKPYSANSEKELYSNIETSVPLICWGIRFAFDQNSPLMMQLM